MTKREEEPILEEFEVIEEELNYIFPETYKQAGPRATDLSSVYKKIHKHNNEKPLTALCLSGGGIRSATFSLGVLQALARSGQLGKFQYLSTVSGGGYIGSWLSRWREEKGTKEVFDSLTEQKDSEPLAIKNLRAFSNFIAPRRGWSADTWSLVVLYFRNLFLNWLILVPLLLALLLLPRVNLMLLEWRETSSIVSWGSIAFLALTVFVVGISLPLAGKDRVNKAWVQKSCPFVLWFASVLLVLDWLFCCGSTPPFAQKLLSIMPVSFVGRVFDWKCNLSCSMLVSAVPSILLLAGILLKTVIKRIPTRFGKKKGDERKGEIRDDLAKRTIAVVVTWVAIGLLLHANTYFLWPWLTTYPYLRLLATLAVPFALFSYTLVAMIWVGLTALWTDEADREWWAASGGVAMAIAVGWASLHAMVFYLPSLLLRLGANFTVVLAGLGGFAGIATAVGGYFSRRSLGNNPKASHRIKEFLGKWGLNVGAFLFIILYLGVGGSLLTGYLCGKYFPPTHFQTNSGKDASQNLIRNYPSTSKAVNDLIADLKEDLRKIEGNPSAALTLEEAALEKVAGDLFQTAARNELIGLENEFGRNLFLFHQHLEANAQGYEATFAGTQSGYVFFVSVGLLCFALLLSALFGVNRFSLHSVYGNRLIRAYLGAFRSRRERVGKSDPITGFDARDNVPMLKLRFIQQDTETPNSPCLFHVLNMTLNLVGGDRLEWQQRKGSSFTVSPLHAGSWSLTDDHKGQANGDQPDQGKAGRYRYVAQYGGKYFPGEDGDSKGGPISLGRAMAISGAAVSPNMGYISSRLIACVMTFFNLRLGWWLPNPGEAGRRVWKRKEPTVGCVPLVCEALGKTTGRSSFVYLSDGGHFDNLGLYEMVRRRCRKVLVVDAGADPDFLYDDLSRTIRKIRTDLGVSIEFPQASGPVRGVPPKNAFTLGRIRYPEIDAENDKHHKEWKERWKDGVLIYIKPFIKGDEPIDIREYAANHCKNRDRFPHQSTMDQFFDESQFESYRMLGLHLGNQAMDAIGDWDTFDWMLPGGKHLAAMALETDGSDQAKGGRLIWYE